MTSFLRTAFLENCLSYLFFYDRIVFHSFKDFSDPVFLDGACERVRKLIEYDPYEPFVELPADLPGASLPVIKQLCRARGIPGYSKIAKSGAGKAVLDDILEQLRTWEAPDDLDHHIKVALFRCWFITGGASSTAMKLGLLNEPFVLKGLREFTNRNSSFTDSEGDEWTFKLKFVRQCGLVVRQEEFYMATSADGIIIADITSTSLDWISGEHILPVEIKTRSGEKELDFAHRQPPFSVLRLDADMLSHEDQAALFKKCIPSRENRAQILHHALVYTTHCDITNEETTNSVLFVEASKDSIIRTVLILFPADLRKSFEKVVNHLAIKHLDWVYSADVDIPPFTRSELGEVGEVHTLAQNLDLWRTAHDMYFENDCSPFGHISTIVPALVAYWNTTKGGIDSGLSRYLANVHPSPYRVIPFESVLWDRVIMTGILNAFNLSKWDRLSVEQIKACTTFAQLKQISQRGFTFKRFLSDAMKHFRIHSERARNSAGGAPQGQVDTSTMTRGERIVYYNSVEGRARRSNADSSHGLTKASGQHKCMVCDLHRIHWSCECCTDMYFCIETIRDHPSHPDRTPARNQLYWTCRDIFHNSRFTLPT